VGRLDGLKDRAPGLHKFLTRRDRPWPLLREAIGGALVILLLVGCLYGFTGQPLSGGYPVVVVTSGSMMHCTNLDDPRHDLGRYCDPTVWGRVGTIDPGDLVFVRAVGDPSSVQTLGGNGDATYGNHGDVLVYRPYGSTATTPIIHRALFWLQVNGDGTFTVTDLGLDHVRTLDQPKLVALTKCQLATNGVHGQLGIADSGFITKGDNNPAADQCPASALSGPVRTGWILGKARGELAWIGLVKLFVDSLGGSPNFANAGGDTKIMMVVVLVVLLVGPWAIERVVKARRRKEPPASPPAAP
jgi:signal peptidase I